MEEQDDSKKRARAKPTKEEIDNFINRCKRNAPTLNGQVLYDTVRNSKGNLFIMKGYKNEMQGMKIPDEMVIRAANGRWFTEEEVQNFATKSTDRCPTYEICEKCLGSGPTGMHCQVCKKHNDYYQCPYMGVFEKKWLDAEWISRMPRSTHYEARADMIQTYPERRTPSLGWCEDGIKMMLRNTYLEQLSQADPVGFYETTKRKRYGEQVNAEVAQDMELFKMGIETGIPDGEYNFPNKKAMVLPYNNADEYHGE
jgi:hypothetical protein